MSNRFCNVLIACYVFSLDDKIVRIVFNEEFYKTSFSIAENFRMSKFIVLLIISTAANANREIIFIRNN